VLSEGHVRQGDRVRVEMLTERILP
jgi:hypothetical protein